MAARKPPRFVPTLTEVVASAPAADGALASREQQEQQLVSRVMRRIDLTLERRLREAIASVVLEQTRLLTPALRQEIEAVVRQTVTQAVADELAHKPQSLRL